MNFAGMADYGGRQAADLWQMPADRSGWLTQHRNLNMNAPMINETGQAVNYPQKPGVPPGQAIGNNLMQMVGSMRDGSPMSAQKTDSHGWSLGSAIGGAFGAGGRFAGAAPAMAQGIPRMFGQQEPTGFASAYLR